MMIEQPAPSDFRWISPEMVGKIRTESRPLGGISILLSVLLIFPVVWVGNQLPAAEHPMMGFVIIAGLGTNLCLFLSGVGVLNGPKCVQSGYLWGAPRIPDSGSEMILVWNGDRYDSEETHLFAGVPR